MSGKIIKSHNSLEEEIEKRRTELDQLENELAELELAYATLEIEISFFERRYNARVGPLLVELDEINARIAEAIAILSPQDCIARERATTERKRAQKTFNEVYGSIDNQDVEEYHEKFAPTDDIKQLYRKIAKSMHPDLAKNDSDREIRHCYMAEANRAYREQNIERLMEILHEWETIAESSPTNWIDVELERLNRSILQVRQKIRETKDKINLLKGSEIGQLKSQADIAEERGEDLILLIALEIQAQINKKNKRILHVVKMLAQSD